jgi:hypothetical protein
VLGRLTFIELTFGLPLFSKFTKTVDDHRFDDRKQYHDDDCEESEVEYGSVDKLRWVLTLVRIKNLISDSSSGSQAKTDHRDEALEVVDADIQIILLEENVGIFDIGVVGDARETHDQNQNQKDSYQQGLGVETKTPSDCAQTWTDCQHIEECKTQEQLTDRES